MGTDEENRSADQDLGRMSTELRRKKPTFQQGLLDHGPKWPLRIFTDDPGMASVPIRIDLTIKLDGPFLAGCLGLRWIMKVAREGIGALPNHGWPRIAGLPEKGRSSREE